MNLKIHVSNTFLCFNAANHKHLTHVWLYVLTPTKLVHAGVFNPKDQHNTM